VSPRLICHPMDAERVRALAARFGASVLAAENWPADRIGMDGFTDWASVAGEIAVALPGWRVGWAWGLPMSPHREES